jgi:hypothetical protein
MDDLSDGTHVSSDALDGQAATPPFASWPSIVDPQRLVPIWHPDFWTPTPETPSAGFADAGSDFPSLPKPISAPIPTVTNASQFADAPAAPPVNASPTGGAASAAATLREPTFPDQLRQAVEPEPGFDYGILWPVKYDKATDKPSFGTPEIARSMARGFASLLDRMTGNAPDFNAVPISPDEVGVVMALAGAGGVKIGGAAADETLPSILDRPGTGNDAAGGIFGARGQTSGRPFDPANAGGPVERLSTDGVKITDDGIDLVEQHLSRFERHDANEFMVSRLRQIANGELEATPYDFNFYTHEIRELQRYSNLGWPRGQPADLDVRHELWNNAHTATLEDYGLKDGQLYHPDAPK